jgi:hypothetical protein
MRLRRPARIALSVCAALAGAVALLEAAVRLRQLARHGTTSTKQELVEDPASGLSIPVPGSRVGPVAINSLGFRGPEIELPKPPERTRIAFLGGSTTFCARASSEDKTWPALVVAGLHAEHPGVDLDLVNAGVPGYSAVQSLLNLEHRVAALAPDVVVIYHGTNDLTQISREMAYAAGLVDSLSEQESFLSRYSVAWSLLGKNLRYRRRTTGRGAELELDTAALAARFRDCVERLVAAAQRTADVVVLVTFSYRQRREQSPAELREASGSSLYYMPWLSPESVLAGFETVNEVLRGVAAERGAVLVGGELAIPADAAHFADSVHFFDPGERSQADRVLAGLRASEAFRDYLATRAALTWRRRAMSRLPASTRPSPIIKDPG